MKLLPASPMRVLTLALIARRACAQDWWGHFHSLPSHCRSSMAMNRLWRLAGLGKK